MTLLSRFLAFPAQMRFKVGGTVALAGLAVGCISLVAFGRQITGSGSGALFLLSAFVGAYIAGICLAPLIGRQGWRGCLLSFAAFLSATLLGGVLAGLLYVGINDLDLVAVLLTLILLSPLAVFWLLVWAGVHWGSRWVRKTAQPMP